MAGLPKKYAKMGFKKGWREYKKTRGGAKRRKRSKGRRMSGGGGGGGGQRTQLVTVPASDSVELMGRPRRRRRCRRMSGEIVTFAGERKGLPMIIKLLTDGLVMAGGAIGGNVVANMIPVPSQFKVFLPIGLGAGLAFMKMPILRAAGLGMVTGGILSASKKFLGDRIPALAGEDGDEVTAEDVRDALLTGEITPDEAAELADLLEDEGLMGEIEDFAGEGDDFSDDDDDDEDLEGEDGIDDEDLDEEIMDAVMEGQDDDEEDPGVEFDGDEYDMDGEIEDVEIAA